MEVLADVLVDLKPLLTFLFFSLAHAKWRARFALKLSQTNFAFDFAW